MSSLNSKGRRNERRKAALAQRKIELASWEGHSKPEWIRGEWTFTDEEVQAKIAQAKEDIANTEAALKGNGGWAA